jgi:hypothetical protein
MDPHSSHQDASKHYFLGFTTRFRAERTFRDSTGGLEVLQAQGYMGKFHWHDGPGRLAIDACSSVTSDGSQHPRFSAYLAYHSLPIILGYILQAWSLSPRRWITPR